MAILYAHVQVIGRSSGPGAVAAAAYRSGSKLHDERIGRSHDFRAKAGVVHSEILLPDRAPERWRDRQVLWNEVEAVERRKDAQLVRELEVAIPRELSREEVIRLAQGFVREQFVSRGMVAALNVPMDTAADGTPKPHAHVMLTMRQAGPDRFGVKVREWNSAELYASVRERWASLANERLAELGHEVRIDHRSYAEQGIGLEPQHKIGPAGARRLERGESAERAEEHRGIARRNGERILEDPSLVLAAVTRQHSTFTRADLARLSRRRLMEVGAGMLQTIDYKILLPNHRRVLRTIGRYSRTGLTYSRQFPYRACKAVGGVSEMRARVRRITAPLAAVLAGIACWNAGPAMAQAPAPGFERRTGPGTDQPALPDPEFAPRDAPTFQLPPLPTPPPEGLSSGRRIRVRDIVITGNTALASEELEAVARAYEGRDVAVEELFQLKDELTLAYVRAGYVNSGAVLPDQEVVDGVVRLEIVEGELEAVRITGAKALAPGFLEQRLRVVGGPLNVNALQERLQLLLLDPSVARVNARLTPGSRPGQAVLDVELEEARRYAVELRAANNRSPSIGGTQGEVALTWRSLLGRSDPVDLTLGVTEGLREVTGRYSVPLTASDLRFRIEGEYSDADIVDDDVEDLDIESSDRSVTLGLGLPLIDTVANRVGLDLALTRERTRTYLLGERFSFSEGANRGEIDLTLLRFTQDWQNRGRSRALALASTFTFGLDALGATDNEDEPTGEFFAWLGQGQLAQRLFRDDDQLVLRGSLQLTPDRLLAPEQFAAGGLDSVRGYRVNEIVRDQGWLFSVEYRYPIFGFEVPALLQGGADASSAPERSTVELVPFVDTGGGFDEDGSRHKVLASVGAGFRWLLPPRLRAELYFGLPLTDRGPSADDALQDAGIGFRLGLGF